MTPNAKHASDLFPIRTVSSLTGVNSVTLRAWERRYGLIRPKRTEKGHRLYSREDIDLINRILALLDKGVSIGQVSGALKRQESTATATEANDPWLRYRNRMIAAIIRFDEPALEDTYNEVLSLYPVADITSKLIVPLLMELGRRWESAEGSVAEEHFFSVYLRNKLGARFHHRPRNARGPKLICACVPGEQHELGLLLFALTAVNQDFRVILLGTDLPLSELPTVQKRSGADGVVLSGSGAGNSVLTESELRRLVNSVSVPVFVGGVASVMWRDEIARAGATPLGEDVEHGLRALASRLEAADS